MTLPGNGWPVSGSRIVGDAGEVAAALRLRQHRARVGRALLVLEPLVVAEHEQPVPHQRAADRAAELVLLQLRLGGREVVLRLEPVVAVELPGARRASSLLPDLGDDVDDRAGVAPVLGAVGMREDLELLDRIRRRTQHEAGVERVVVRRAVEQEVVRLIAHAVDVEAAGGVAEAARRGVAVLARRGRRAARTTPGISVPSCVKLRPFSGRSTTFCLIDDDAERGVRRFDERRLRRTVTCSVDLSDLQRQIARAVSLTTTMTPSRIAVRKPVSVALTG